MNSPRKRTSEISPSLVEAYNQAWARYEARCLWNVRRVAQPTAEDARDVAQRLRQYGDMSARRLAARIDGEAVAHAQAIAKRFAKGGRDVSVENFLAHRKEV